MAFILRWSRFSAIDTSRLERCAEGNSAATSPTNPAFTSLSSTNSSSRPGSREPDFCRSSQSASSRTSPLAVSAILALFEGSAEQAVSQRSRTAVMSLSIDGKGIQCDCEDCPETVSLPIALRARLLPLHLRAATADGWLIINGASTSRHFCPDCASRQLECMVAFDSRKETCVQERLQEDKTTEECS
jgi:hypothetical protein